MNHFYSDELYGEHVSRTLKAENRQIDRNRCVFQVSATMIRENPFKYKEFIDPVVYWEKHQVNRKITAIEIKTAPDWRGTTNPQADTSSQFCKNH